jgi:hypothetical protein
VPPFSPLGAGETIVATPSTVIELGLTVAGDVSSFDATKREDMKANLENSLGCHEPSCLLTLHIAAGSVEILAVLTIPDEQPSGVESEGGSAAPSSVAAAVNSAASALVVHLRNPRSDCDSGRKRHSRIGGCAAGCGPTPTRTPTGNPSTASYALTPTANNGDPDGGHRCSRRSVRL